MQTNGHRPTPCDAARIVRLRTLGFALAVASMLGVAGCEQKSTTTPGQNTKAPNAGSSASAPGAADRRTYVVRGIIRELPLGNDGGRTQFMAQHEAIDNFVGYDGKLVGMNSMLMAFPMGPGMSLEGFAVNDIVKITFDVVPSEKRYFMTALEKLPAGTELEFRKADTSRAAASGG